jgi:hypothetical protein
MDGTTAPVKEEHRRKKAEAQNAYERLISHFNEHGCYGSRKYRPNDLKYDQAFAKLSSIADFHTILTNA